jgi:hypothetical protein
MALIIARSYFLSYRLIFSLFNPCGTITAYSIPYLDKSGHFQHIFFVGFYLLVVYHISKNLSRLYIDGKQAPEYSIIFTNPFFNTCRFGFFLGSNAFAISSKYFSVFSTDDNLHVIPPRRGVGYEKGVVHINGWSDSAIDWLREFLKGGFENF